MDGREDVECRFSGVFRLREMGEARIASFVGEEGEDEAGIKGSEEGETSKTPESGLGDSALTPFRASCPRRCDSISWSLAIPLTSGSTFSSTSSESLAISLGRSS